MRVPAWLLDEDPMINYADEYEMNFTPDCEHKFVNVGFTSRLMVCKYCDLEET